MQPNKQRGTKRPTKTKKGNKACEVKQGCKNPHRPYKHESKNKSIQTQRHKDRSKKSVDTVFCPPFICMLNFKNFKNINFLPWDHKNIQIDMVKHIQASKHSK